MCGIIAHVGTDRALGPLVTGLEKLEYRGYDSAGVAVKNGNGLDVWKCSGQVSELKDTIDTVESSATLGIGHTRWSTHGPPSDENAHPHTDESDRVAVVHNGIIENYESIKQILLSEGYEFTSDTDTEVIPNLIAYYLDRGNEPLAAFKHTVADLEGSYAIAVVVDGNDSIFAARQGSPLVLGVEQDGYYLASDVPAFLDYTDTVVYLEDGDTVEVRTDGVDIVDENDEHVQREVQQVDWQPDETGKGQYDHFMLKEIHTQPTSLQKTIEGRIDADEHVTDLDVDLDLTDIDTVHLVGCGTSYHAALFGSSILNRCDVSARAIRASEYDVNTGTPPENTLFVAVTQSGETADTLQALRQASDVGASTLAVTNVVQSTAAREADEPLYIRAGPEIGVAATKTFSSQAVMLTMLSQHIARVNETASRVNNVGQLLSDLRALPSAVDRILKSSDAGDLAQEHLDKNAYFFIGRGLGCSVAKEGALKFKEITYEHAEGFASGELKHGPLALVTERTPVFAVCADDCEKTVTNAKEAQTRGAPIVAVSPPSHKIVDTADAHLSVPDMHPVCSNLLANVQLQLLSYYCATELDRAIDKPRNLAKSVTVE
ncbi:glutamine--fructose-6-phosphate transaminase (isomerizing) [Haloferax larsenii]|uniref:Glutamine--fructose-6-phosphate aminotransferase [isomerizing] n=1 Tax=Haloferax larsenii TaxID=302484 RepID=A0A1H7V1Y5_HALLR|nr:glutamine--fructose-6-phosphate transaminase (isomerizing) [Haloferax larsenii]SEM03154.1 glucosamine--fructose-6-phosphate aminotransferase (isomerizing) [Haloferax larsenii]